MSHYNLGCTILGGHDDCWPEILGSTLPLVDCVERGDMFADLLGASTTAPDLDTVRAGKAVIKKGMTGDSVKFVQGIVGVLGDGIFGPATEAAVKKLQTQNKIKADGIVNQATMAALDIAGQTGGSGGITTFDFTVDDVPPASAPKPAASQPPAVFTPPSTESPSHQAPAASSSGGGGWSTSTIVLGIGGLGAVGAALWMALRKGTAR